MKRLLERIFNAVMLFIFMTSAVGFVFILSIFVVGESLRKHLEEPNECCCIVNSNQFIVEGAQ